MYSIFLTDPNGRRVVALTQAISLQVARALNEVGVLRLEIPAALVDERLLVADAALEVWRTLDTISKRIGWFYIQRVAQRVDERGKTIEIVAVDDMDLLRRRIVYAPAGSAGAHKSGPADDVIKAIVRENLGADASAERQVAGLVVHSDLSAAPSIERSFAYRNVLDVCQNIAAQSAALGTRLYFRLERLDRSTREFYTRVHFAGADRRDRVAPFAVERGTLAVPVALAVDYANTATFVYAGGQGEGADREFATAGDTAISDIFRREIFVDARNAKTTAALAGEAEAALWQYQVREEFTASLVDAPGARFQVDWDLGDLVTAAFERRQFSCIVQAVFVRVTETDEQITARLEAVEV